MRLAPLAGALALLCMWSAAPAAAGTPYEVGAAKVDITPPAASDTSATPAAFARCPPGMNGPRKWAFDEPYTDVDNSGDFNYPGGLPEPYCDANADGRWDGIFVSGGVDHPATNVHDPLDARAVAISDGTHTVVIVSVVAQGLFENYIDGMRSQAEDLRHGIDDVVVSANHNESSPDTLGIYGAPPVPEDVPVVGGQVGENSGIDEYYMDFLQSRVAHAAADAYDALKPASLWTTTFQVNQENDGKPPLPAGVRVELSHNFPTTNDDRTPAAVDPKVRVLQARDGSGSPIATVMNLAAHNQEIGHGDSAPYDLSSDWPGYFHDRLESDLGGMAMFLVGDNGSEEDPQTDPPVDCSGKHPCYEQAQATGDALADAVAASAPGASELRGGTVGSSRKVFFAPLENNLFKGAAALGLFGKRQLYTNGVPTGRVGNDLKTSVATVRVGPDLQFLANPGEAFPALMLGSPWGIEDVGCPERPNPPVPTWHASAPNRFQIGLADDMIGYEEPAWAFTSLPGALNYNGVPATCVDDADDKDPKGHQHKLETEGAGPTASNVVADNLSELLDATPDPAADIRLGRFVYRDGALSRRPQRPDGHGGTEDAIAIWLTNGGATSLTPGNGTIVALDPIGAFGDVPVDAAGRFMDYDGQGQGSPDITTRGMLTGDATNPDKRYYLNVYPSLSTSPLPAAKDYCDDTSPPDSAIKSARARRPVKVSGTASDAGCDGGQSQVSRSGQVAKVEVAWAKRVRHHRCRFLHLTRHGQPAGLGTRRPCDQPRWIAASGTGTWHLRARRKPLPSGRYVIRSRATDAAGNVEARPARLRLRVR